MKFPSLNLVAAVAIAALIFAYSCERDRLAQERVARFNAEAAADTTRLVFHSASLKGYEKRAFLETQNITIKGELGKALVASGQQTQALIELTVKLDSLHQVLRTGTVTASAADSSVRELEASIDTAGYHVRVNADVPAPPRLATVRWFVSRDSVRLAAALNRNPDGSVALRAATADAASVRIDTVRVRYDQNLRKTQSLAMKLAALLVAFVAGRASR